MRHVRPAPAWLVVVACAMATGACGGSDGGAARTTTPAPTPQRDTGEIQRDPANASVAIAIGSKNFTEQKVLGEIYAQGLRAAGYTVTTDLGIGDQDVALRALKGGQIDAYPEYTGTALLSFFGKKASELPKSSRAAFEQAKQGFAAETPPLVAYPPTPFTSSNEVAVTRETADRLHLKTISDLSSHAKDLTLYGSPECRKRLDCLRGLTQVYGLTFKKFVPVAIAKRHKVLKSGRADVSIVFTTDPQIRRDQEVLLEDDKGMFPPYNTTLVVRKSVADKAGADLAKTIKLLQEQLTDENMQELNARVDLDMRDPAVVAKEYLQETGLVAGS
jgi:osmoprotectant transport system substrate-binding protein